MHTKTWKWFKNTHCAQGTKLFCCKFSPRRKEMHLNFIPWVLGNHLLVWSRKVAYTEVAERQTLVSNQPKSASRLCQLLTVVLWESHIDSSSKWGDKKMIFTFQGTGRLNWVKKGTCVWKMHVSYHDTIMVANTTTILSGTPRSCALSISGELKTHKSGMRQKPGQSARTQLSSWWQSGQKSNSHSLMLLFPRFVLHQSHPTVHTPQTPNFGKDQGTPEQEDSNRKSQKTHASYSGKASRRRKAAPGTCSMHTVLCPSARNLYLPGHRSVQEWEEASPHPGPTGDQVCWMLPVSWTPSGAWGW